MTKIIKKNNNLLIDYGNDIIFPFPVIDLDVINLNNIKQFVKEKNENMVLSEGRNLTIDELINIFRIGIIKEIKNKFEE